MSEKIERVCKMDYIRTGFEDTPQFKIWDALHHFFENMYLDGMTWEMLRPRIYSGDGKNESVVPKINPEFFIGTRHEYLTSLEWSFLKAMREIRYQLSQVSGYQEATPDEFRRVIGHCLYAIAAIEKDAKEQWSDRETAREKLWFQRGMKPEKEAEDDNRLPEGWTREEIMEAAQKAKAEESKK